MKKPFFPLLAVFLLATIAAKAEPGPSFSFKYDGRQISSSESIEVDSRLKVTLEKKEYPEYNAVEWVLWFQNDSDTNSGVLSEICDCDCLIPLPQKPEKFIGLRALEGDRAVITCNGPVNGINYLVDDIASSEEFKRHPEYFHPHTRDPKYFTCNGSRSSDGILPFFEVTQNKQGAIIAIGWTGAWQASFKNCQEGVMVKTGLRTAEFYLEPGEKLRTTSVLIMEYSDDENASNKFRSLLRKHVSHQACQGNPRNGIFGYELWGGLPTEEMLRRIEVIKGKDLTYEDLWIDAGWSGYGKKCDDNFTGDWGAYNGDFNVNSRIHPNGLKDVSQVAADAGMGMFLWLEPERISPVSHFYNSHQEWLLKTKNDQNALLYLGNDQAREYLTEVICQYARELNFSVYRQDFNIDPTGYFAENDKPGRVGITEIRHILGLYKFWDDILAANPGMLIDNCASGGRRIDIETLKRSIPFFRSDYQCGFNASGDVLQAHNAGISYYLPFNGCTTKSSDAYSLRSAFSSSYGVQFFNGIHQKEEDVDWAAAEQTCREYLQIRDYLSKDFYNLGSSTSDPTAWAVWQYQDPDKREGTIIAFRRAEATAESVSISLGGIPSGTAVKVENLSEGGKSKAKSDKLTITLKEKLSSVVLKYSY